MACSAEFDHKTERFSDSHEFGRLNHFLLWEVGKDVNGLTLANSNIRAGDVKFARGLANEALKHYQYAQEGHLSEQEIEALAIRWAAVYGYQYKFDRGLKLLSAYFKSNGIRAEEVRGPAALMLGVLYAEKNDIDQGLAWLSACLERNPESQQLIARAKESLARIIAGSTDTELASYITKWRTKPLIVALSKAELEVRNEGSEWQSVKIASDSKALNVLALLPLSGSYKILGESTKAGIEVVVDRLKVQQPISVTYIDTNDQIATNSQLLEAIKKRDVDGVLGPVLDEHQFIQHLRGLDVPVIHFSKDESAEVGDGVFRLGITPSSQVGVLRDVIVKSGLKKVALVYPDNAVGKELAQALMQTIVKTGGDITISLTSKVGNDEGEVSKLAKQIEDSNSDGVFHAGKLEEAVRLFSKFSDAYRQRVMPLGTALWYNSTKLQNMGKVMSNARFVVPYYTDNPTGPSEQFLKDYVSKNGTAPNFLAAQGADAMMLLGEALFQSRSEGVRAISAFSTLQPVEGLTGELAVGADGEVQRRYKVLSYDNGVFKEAL